jgi:hypothetical protein
MPRTKKFNDLVQSQVKADKKFAQALLREGVDAMLNGDIETGKSLLRDTIKATVGFEQLAKATGAPAKSLIRMFGRAAIRRRKTSSPSSAICRRRPGCICTWRRKATSSPSSWLGLSRPSTPCFAARKTWMAGTRPGVTGEACNPLIGLSAW